MLINPKVIINTTGLTSNLDVAWINMGSLGSFDQNRLRARIKQK